LSVSFVSSVVLHLADSATPSPSLSQSTPTSPLPGESDSSWLGPGFLGFLSLVFLAVAVFVIYKSLNKQLKRVTFDEAAVNAEVTGAADVAAPQGVGPTVDSTGTPGAVE
jgi:hypothetical protein